MGLQRFPVSDFRGGLNTKDGPFGLESNEAQALLNVTLSRRGVLSQRKGKTRFDTAGLPAGVIGHLRNWYTGAVRNLMASVDGDVYAISTAGVATRYVDGTAGFDWHMEQATNSANQDRLWLVNGVDTPKVWDGATPAVDWANAPPNGSILRLWRNRMCIAGHTNFPQRLFFSDIGNPESPAAVYGSNWVDIKTTEDDLDPITWLEVLGDYLIVFKRQSVWAIYDPGTFASRRIGSPGCQGRFMSAVLRGRVYYFNRSGVWSTNGNTAPRLESEKIENFITDNLNYQQINKVRMAASRDRRLFVALPFGSSVQNNRLLEFIPDLVAVEGATDPRAGAWSVHDLPVSALCTFRAVNVDKLVGADSAGGKVHNLFEGTNDDGAAISSYWQTGWRSIISEEPFERVRRVNVELTGQVKVDVYRDFASSSSFSQLLTTTSDDDPLWDGGTWDGGMWDPSSGTALVRARPETRARYHSVKLSNSTVDKAFDIYALELAVRGGKEH